MAQDKDKDKNTSNAENHSELAKAERQEKIAQLKTRRSKLSPDDAALLHEEYSTIVAPYIELLWSYLRRQRLDDHEAEELYQEGLLALYNHLLEHGFPDVIPAMLLTLTDHKVSNYLRVKGRAPESTCLPSSTSEAPRSQFDVEKALHHQGVARKTFLKLSPDHQAVLTLVEIDGLTHTDAAAALGLPEGTLKSRLRAAKHALLALLNPILPPSQR